MDVNKYAVQGRTLPFTDEDVIPLGISIVEPSAYQIEIDTLDGLFLGSQNIYLKDKMLNVLHDLKNSAYTFSSTIGTVEDRFELVFKNELLSNDLVETSDLIVYQSGDLVHLNSVNDEIQQIEVYDLLGRRVFHKSKVYQTEYSFSVQGFKNQMLVVKVITLNQGMIATKIITN
jgi:hypothetical protein